MKMKKFNIVYVLAAMVLVLASCKDEVGPTLQDPTAPALTAPATGTSMVLTEANAKDAITFNWSAATGYGFAAAITYKVQMSLPGDNFGKPSAVVTTAALTGELTNGDLNNLLMAAELAPDTDSDIQFRIEASVSEFVPSVYSPAVTLKVKPYRVIVNYPKLYCPGSYQGWAPDKAPVVSSLLSDGKYEGYLWFADAGVQFKFTDGPSWDKNWGDDGVDGTLNPNGANIVSGDAGQYKVNVNLPALTYTLVKTDWGVIGSATAGGWDSDQNMTFDAAAGVWKVTLDLVAGDLKFRANDDWPINLGDNKTNKSLEYEGANIPIAAAGNYTVILDLRGPIYTYVITKN
jgi:hypothetical protein